MPSVFFRGWTIVNYRSINLFVSNTGDRKLNQMVIFRSVNQAQSTIRSRMVRIEITIIPFRKREGRFEWLEEKNVRIKDRF